MAHALTSSQFLKMVQWSIMGKSDFKIGKRLGFNPKSISRWMKDQDKLATLTDSKKRELHLARKSRRRPPPRINIPIVEILNHDPDKAPKEYPVIRRSYSRGRSWYASEHYQSKPWQEKELESALFALVRISPEMKTVEARECLSITVKRIELAMSHRGSYRDAQKLRSEILRLGKKGDPHVFGTRNDLNCELEELTYLLSKNPVDETGLLVRCVELWRKYLASFGFNREPVWLRRLSAENPPMAMTKDSPGRSIRLVWHDHARPREGEVAVVADIEPDGRISTHTQEFTSGSHITSLDAARKAEVDRLFWFTGSAAGP